jgi:osmotically-inducible protein OsmY
LENFGSRTGATGKMGDQRRKSLGHASARCGRNAIRPIDLEGGVMTLRSASRLDRTAAFAAATLAVLGAWSGPLGAQEAGGAPSGGQVVITGKKSPPVPDEEVTRWVQAALHSNRYFNDDRVTVTTKDGVVTLEGVVVDPMDLFVALRISRRIPGVMRVDDQLEISDMWDFDLDDH